MIDVLKQERGQEKMRANNASQRRPDVAAAGPRPFTPPSSTSTATSTSNTPQNQNHNPTSTLDLAKQHRDRLLHYQSQNAQRTTVRDEAADYETPSSGLSQWASPTERAQQLKRQQKVLREQEWSAKPEYEKRRVVVSVDLVGGKVVKRMGNVERGGGGGGDGGGAADVRQVEEVGVDKNANGEGIAGAGGHGGKGAFSSNPLMGSLIRPLWKPREDHSAEGKGKGKASDADATVAEDDKENAPRQRRQTWRRVQDDNDDDNEGVILDGGVYGGRGGGEEGEEPDCG